MKEVIENSFIIKNDEYIKVDIMVWVVGVKVFDFIKDIGIFEFICNN